MAVATATVTEAVVAMNAGTKPGVSWALRSATLPTTAFVASSHMLVSGKPSAHFVVTYASADYTSIQVLVQGSYDASAWFSIPSSFAATNCDAHSQTLANLDSATGASYTIDVPITNGRILYVRVLPKRTGGTAVGTVAVTGHLGARVG